MSKDFLKSFIESVKLPSSNDAVALKLKQIKESERKEKEALNSRNFLQYSAILAVLIFLLLFFNFC